MSSIWSTQATQTGTSPFQNRETTPLPGGMTSAKVQSAGKTAAQPRLSPAGGRGVAGSMAASSTSSTNSSTAATSNSASTISSNDFLSLLVTEMQNQDPTASTDPNEYINQLVGINSLEQLISMNQNLASVLGAATSTPTSGAQATNVAASQVSGVADKIGSGSASSGSTAIHGSTPNTAVAANAKTVFHGNLSATNGKPAADAVANSLSGRSRGSGNGHGFRDIPTH